MYIHDMYYMYCVYTPVLIVLVQGEYKACDCFIALPQFRKMYFLLTMYMY